ncbi:Hypothetical protein SMAX5B_003430 [Scophthalmus maximus]|uniref:Uncharacterized protein n=1 Tax=Scophthalmus maximus TaxID=52904 RepID=A0A2U9CJQ5_SCOMX|nr:Hypothetical protein SMAX5B_003430 [Scophthalmus maximus]
MSDVRPLRDTAYRNDPMEPGRQQPSLLQAGRGAPEEETRSRIQTEVIREKNWNFLRNYDQMGQLKSEEPLPSYVSLFSERVPNTTNHVFGSRLSTPLGSELVRLDRLLLWSGSHHKRKQDPEVLPC